MSPLRATAALALVVAVVGWPAGRARAADCMSDQDCPGAACGGEVCDFVTGTPICVPAGSMQPQGLDGECATTEDCKCAPQGAVCRNPFCSFTLPPGVGGTAGTTGTSGAGGSSRSGAGGVSSAAGTGSVGASGSGAAGSLGAAGSAAGAPSNSEGGGCMIAGGGPAWSGAAIPLLAAVLTWRGARRRRARR